MTSTTWATLPLRLAVYVSRRAWPLWCTFAVTDRCSSRCLYCSFWSSGADRLSTADCKLIVRRVARGGVAHVILSGGEVLLRSDIPDIVVEGKRTGLTVGINTSGVPGTPGTYKRLMDAGLDRLTFSIDAATPTVHDRLRPGAPWRRVVRNLEEAIRIRDQHRHATRIGTTTVLTRENVKEILPLVALRKDMGADWNSFQPVWSRPTDRDFRSKFGFDETDTEALDETRSVLRTIADGNVEPYYEILPSLYGLEQNEAARPCYAGRAFVHVDSHGNLGPCSPLGFRFGSLLEEDAGMLLRAARSQRFFRWAGDGSCPGCNMTCYQERNLLLSAARTRPFRVFRQAAARYLQ